MSEQYPNMPKEIRGMINNFITNEMQRTDREKILALLNEFKEDFISFYKKHGVDWNLRNMVFYYLQEIKKVLKGGKK